MKIPSPMATIDYTTPIKRTTLAQLHGLYNGLSQATKSFKSATDHTERARRLDLVKYANEKLLEALSYGVRRSAESIFMVERALCLSAQANEMHTDDTVKRLEGSRE